MTDARRRWRWLLVLLAVCLHARAGERAYDPYERYVNTSEDFRRVKQDKSWCDAAFPSWTYMPWTYQWTIGYTPAAGEWSVAHGYNGAFVDHGDIADNASPTGRLDWIDRYHLRFYVDHLAGKGDLHLWDGDKMRPHANEVHGNGVRSRPVNEAMFRALQETMRRNVRGVRSSPNRGAYALDDEISWGHFVHPAMWCVTDDRGAYQKWLEEIYGAGQAPRRDRWVTYEQIRPQLPAWTIDTFDASPLMDQWTFNDSYWNNFIGRLVEFSNTLDDHTPCGFVGGQCPDAFGGYDYAKVMRKVQYIEAYNIGSSQAIIRSFNPHNAIPSVTSEFHQSADDDIWQTWYYLAHGNRGMIGWVENWFDGEKPKAWHEQVAPTNLAAANKIGPLMSGAEWVHDGVAIYYSHASIQLGWILDAEAHGKTWTNRNGDERLGASFMVRHAWENMLRDSGLQYNFISYADVVQQGIPSQYRVLILPACLCLSDAEARRIKEFCRGGGTVIADYLPGVWDQHGKGRAGGGALDDMFGVHHDGQLGAKDLFGGRLWCEVDQDANFSWHTYEEFLTHENQCIRDASGFNKAVRAMPVNHTAKFANGTAVLMNLSPQWYNAYRETEREAPRRREVFMAPVIAAAGRRWVTVEPAEGTLRQCEVTYWRKGARTIVFICANPEVAGSQTGGGNANGLQTKAVDVTVRFAAPVREVRDERTEAWLGKGQVFKSRWKQNEALVLSFEGAIPRGDPAK